MSLEKVIMNISESIVLKILNLATNWFGIMISIIGTGVISFVGDNKKFIYYILAAIVVDLFWGIMSSKKQGRYTLSQAISKTAVKLAVYASIVFLIMVIEKSVDSEWFVATSFSTAILCTAELWSVLGHILIYKPDTPVICLLEKFLVGEMSRKLNIKEEELKNIMNKRKSDE